MDGTRRINELIAAGVIGPVREVHVWTDRPQRYLGAGDSASRVGSGDAADCGDFTRSGEQSSVAGRRDRRRAATLEHAHGGQRGAARDGGQPPRAPRGAALGSLPRTRRDVPYHPVYHPFSWRGWLDFGVSAIGDMGAHLIDQPFWALGLDYPTSIVSSSTPWGGTRPRSGAYPLAMTTRYEFAARGTQPARLSHLVRRRADADAHRRHARCRAGGGRRGLRRRAGLPHLRDVRQQSAGVSRAAGAPTRRRCRSHVPSDRGVARGQLGDRRARAKGRPARRSSTRRSSRRRCCSASWRCAPARRRSIEYDGAKMQVTNVPEANAFLTREYREGWSV